MANTIPVVIEKTSGGDRAYDIYSRILEDRIVMLEGEVNTHLASLIVSQLLYLDSVNTTPITLYINSPGGVIYDGLSIVDTMNKIDSPVHTVVNGLAASMGAFILSHGAKGFRTAMPNATIMVHQPLGGTRGQVTDMEISLRESMRLKELLTTQLAENCDKTYDVMLEACERDNYMSSKDALDFGIVDKIGF